VLAKARVCPRQSSAEPEHECCVHNNIRRQLEAFLFIWREIIYKVYGKYMIKSTQKILYLKTMKNQFLSDLPQVLLFDYYCKAQSMVHH